MYPTGMSKSSPGEFEEVSEAHWASVLHLGPRMTGDQNEAEEIAQNTFFLAFRAWPSFERQSAVSTWLLIGNSIVLIENTP